MSSSKPGGRRWFSAARALEVVDAVNATAHTETQGDSAFAENAILLAAALNARASFITKELFEKIAAAMWEQACRICPDSDAQMTTLGQARTMARA